MVSGALVSVCLAVALVVNSCCSMVWKVSWWSFNSYFVLVCNGESTG
jgi:hypothetical protein